MSLINIRCKDCQKVLVQLQLRARLYEGDSYSLCTKCANKRMEQRQVT